MEKISFKNTLKIHEKNTQENHDYVVSINVINTCLLLSSNFYGLENVNSQAFFAN